MRAPAALAVLLAAVLAASPVLAKPGGNDAAPGPGHKAKAALDDRVDPHGAAGASPVGQGTHMGRRETLPGAYFGDRARQAVRSYYAEHPPKVAAGAVKWQVGERLPAGARVQPVPAAIVGKLPKLPPGHRYVQVAGDILLVAAGSQMVVDGISAVAR